MAMRFPYRLVPVGRGIVSLGGRSARPRPLVLASMIGPSGAYARRALLDTAADDTVFPEYAASRIGIDLTVRRPARPLV